MQTKLHRVVLHHPLFLPCFQGGVPKQVLHRTGLQVYSLLVWEHPGGPFRWVMGPSSFLRRTTWCRVQSSFTLYGSIVEFMRCIVISLLWFTTPPWILNNHSYRYSFHRWIWSNSGIFPLHDSFSKMKAGVKLLFQKKTCWKKIGSTVSHCFKWQLWTAYSGLASFCILFYPPMPVLSNAKTPEWCILSSNTHLG